MKAEPALLLFEGRFLHGAMKRERITQEEVWAVLRGQGIATVEEVQAVVLETDGSLSVLKSGAPQACMEALRNVGDAGI